VHIVRTKILLLEFEEEFSPLSEAIRFPFKVVALRQWRPSFGKRRSSFGWRRSAFA
jgi:hypothetical protein